jgi:short-subunit dehydrogenase
MVRPRALVTGASSGIGAAFAEHLAGSGYDLVVVARRERRLRDLADRLKREHGAEVRVEIADLASPADLQRLVVVVGELELELLVNNAGFGAYRPFLEVEPSQIEELIRVLALAPTLLVRAALPGMVARGHGAVVNVASALAFSGAIGGSWLPARATYAAAKSYLVTFSQILASEVNGTGVQIQVLCPSVVATEFHEIQGIDMSRVERASADDVVRASLAALERDDVICLPALADPERITDWTAAAARLLGG